MIIGKSLRARAVAWFAVGVAIGSAAPAGAQATFTGSYSQNFNTLPSTGTPTWSNNTTLLGWYAYGSGANSSNTTREGGTVTPVFTVDPGTSTTGGIHSYGATSASDRALGSIGSGTAGDLAFALVLENTGTQTYTGFNLMYTGEQWRNGGNTVAHVLDLDYTVVSSFSPTLSIPANIVAGYTNPTNLDFTGPIATATAAALDGNATANRVLITASQSVTWAPGEFLIIRWWDNNDSGNDHGLSIDDLFVDAQPFAAHTDTDGVGASADGSLGADEYGPGNSYVYTGGGSGFGGVLGGGSVYLNSDATNLYLAFDPAGTVDNVAVVYFDTQSGGFTDATMSDAGSTDRNVISNLTSGATDAFPFSADYALAIWNDPGSNADMYLYELSGGTHTFIGSVFVSPFDAGNADTLREISIPLADMGLTGGSVVDFFAAYCSTTLFNSNESIPPITALNAGGNPGFGPPGANYATYSRFVVETLCEPPSVTDDPDSASICADDPVTFMVSATGSAPLTYQWRKDSVDIGGANSDSYTIASAEAGDAGSYDCVVTNDCGSDTSLAATLTVQAHATADAGADQTVCATDSVSLTGSATGESSVLWTSNGDGTFADASMASTTYTPGSGDLSSGMVALSLTAVDTSPCTGSAIDSLDVTFVAAPTVDAGADQTICASDAVSLSGSATGAASVLWTSSGDGAFDDASMASATYTPGGGDLAGGMVTLTLTVDATAPCTGSVSDSIDVTIAPAPTADAGADQTICATDTVALSGSATNSSGNSWTTSGDGAFDDASALSAIYTPGAGDVAAGTVVLTLTAGAIAPCTTAASDSLTVSIAGSPSVDAGADQSICAGDSVSLSGAVTGGANPLWSTSGDGTFDDAASLTAVYSPGAGDVSSGSVTLTLSADAIAPCTGTAGDSLTVTIVAGAVVDAGADQSICAGDSVSLSGALTGGSNPMWSSSGDGAFDDATSLVAVYTPGANDVAAGMVTLTLAADSGAPCVSVSDSLDVTIAAGPTVDAGADQSICAGNTVSLSGTVSGGSNPMWSTSGDGTFDDAGALVAVYTPGAGDASSGSVTLSLSVDADAPCTGTASDGLVVSIAPAPSAAAGPDQSICAGNTVSVSGTLAGASSPMWSSSGDGVFDDAGALAAVYTPGAGDVSSGSVTLTLGATADAPCSGAVSDSLAITIAAGPLVDAGMDQMICGGGAVSVSGSITAGSNPMWSSSGDGSFDNANSASANYTPGAGDLSSGTVTLTLTADADAPCTGSASDSLTVTFTQSAMVDAGADQSVCSGEMASLNGVVTSGSNTMWTTGGDGAFADASLASTTYAPGAGDIAAGMVTLTLTASANAPCIGSASDSLDLTIAAGPIVDAGADQSICAGGTVSLSASVANGANALWTTSGDGAFDDAGSATATYTPGAGDVSSGSVDLTWTADANAPCTGSVSDPLTVTITGAPTVDAGPDQNVCSDQSIALSGTVAGGSNPQWTTSGDGSFADAGSAATTYTPGAGDVSAGTVTLTLSADANAPCTGGVSDSLVATLAAGPSVDAGADQSICAGDTVVLSAISANGSNLLWSTSGDGSFADAGMAATTYTPGPNDVGSFGVVLTVSLDADAPCVGTVSDALVVTIASGPTVDAGIDQSVCSGDDVSLSGAVADGQNLMWTTSGDGVFADAASATTDYTPGAGDVAAGTVTLTLVADAIAPCIGPASDSLDVTIATGPSVDAGPDQSICGGSAALSGSVSNGTGVLWTSSGDGAFADAGSASTAYTPGAGDLAAGTVTLTLSADAISPCVGAVSDALVVTIGQGPLVDAGADQSLCAGDSASLAGSVSNGSNPLWTSSGDGTFADAGALATTYTPGAGDATSGSVVLTLTADADAPCTGSVSDSLTLTIGSGAVVDAGADQSLCADEDVSLSGSVTNGTNVLWTTSGDGAFADAGAPGTTYSPGAADMLLGSVTLTLSADAVAPCVGSAADSLVVTLDAAPSISTQPLDADVFVGQPTSFTVVAAGAGPLTYQWRKDGSNVSNGPRISGATAATLSINPTQPVDAANYDCVVSGSCGTATSDVAELRFLDGCPNPQAGCDQSDIYPTALPDCVVDISDLGVVLANYAPGVPGKTRAQGDIWPLGGGDGYVDLSDLGQVLADFGTDCR